MCHLWYFGQRTVLAQRLNAGAHTKKMIPMAVYTIIQGTIIQGFLVRLPSRVLKCIRCSCYIFLMVIEQTIEIPAGPARVELKVTPVNEERHGAEANAEGQAVKSATPHLDALSGIAAHLGDITLEQIREERLSKYM